MAVALREVSNVWQQACSEVAAELLRECGIVAPPVDARDLVPCLGLPVLRGGEHSGWRRTGRIGGHESAVLRPDEGIERNQWALAREIGDCRAWQVFDLVEVDPRETSNRQREQVANLLASCLLLPEEWFERDAAVLDGDVLELKRMYSTASHELILMNLLRLRQLTLVSVFDQGELVRRRGNGQLTPPSLLPVERQAWSIVRASGRPSEASAEGVRVQCWSVTEGGWQRELMRTTALVDIDETPSADDDEMRAQWDDLQYEMIDAERVGGKA